MSKGEKLVKKASEALDIPIETFIGYPRIELAGNLEMILENHRGILEYGDKMIKINAGRVTVKICGENLCVTAMNNAQMSIAGTITSVEFV